MLNMAFRKETHSIPEDCFNQLARFPFMESHGKLHQVKHSLTMYVKWTISNSTSSLLGRTQKPVVEQTTIQSTRDPLVNGVILNEEQTLCKTLKWVDCHDEVFMKKIIWEPQMVLAQHTFLCRCQHFQLTIPKNISNLVCGNTERICYEDMKEICYEDISA